MSVADRSYFKAVVSTGAPFVSEGLVTRNANRRVVIMAVPTRDGAGRLTGVLVGALELRASPTDQRSIDLGFEGLIILDRARPAGDARKLRAAQERRHPSPNQERRGCAHRCPRPRRLERARRRLRQLQGAGLDDGDRPSCLDRLRACPQGSHPRARGDRRSGPRRALHHRLGPAALATGAGGRAAPDPAVGRARPVARRRLRHRRGLGSRSGRLCRRHSRRRG